MRAACVRMVCREDGGASHHRAASGGGHTPSPMATRAPNIPRRAPTWRLSLPQVDLGLFAAREAEQRALIERQSSEVGSLRARIEELESALHQATGEHALRVGYLA